MKSPNRLPDIPWKYNPPAPPTERRPKAVQVPPRQAERYPSSWLELSGSARDQTEGSWNLSVPETTTTRPGYVNGNGQVVVRKTNIPGTDKNQYVYQLACSCCGHVYGANGSDIHLRLCPAHQGGAKGLEYLVS
jgi:hypothetical protein